MDNIQLRDSLTLAIESFFVAKASENLSPRTITTYRDALNRFIGWIRAKGVSDPTQITPAHVRAYIAELNQQDYKSSYVHGLVRPVKTLLRFWYDDEIVPTDVFRRVKMPKLDKPIMPAFSSEDVRKVLDAAKDNLRDTCIFVTLLDSGMRAQELCDLKVGDLNIKTGAIVIQHGKGAKGRTVYVDAKAKRHLLKYLLSRGNPADAEPLFPSARTNEHMTPNGLLLLCRRYAEKTGVQNFHPHTFRHTFVTESLKSGLDLARLAMLCGHSRIEQTKNYAALVQADLQSAHEEHSALNHLLGGRKNGSKK